LERARNPRCGRELLVTPRSFSSRRCPPSFGVKRKAYLNQLGPLGDGDSTVTAETEKRIFSGKRHEKQFSVPNFARILR